MAKSNEESQGEEKMASYADATKTDPKTTSSSTMTGVKPVFVQEIDVFGSLTDRVTTKTLYLTNVEMYQTLGYSVEARSIIGLQRIRGLWRIYLDCESARDHLICKGVEIRGKQINIYSRNPRVTTHENIDTVRFRVKDVPLSADDGQILRALEERNCVIMNHFRERLSNCPNDWVCKSCGKEGHKQIDCVENDLSDNTQHPNEQQSTNENTNDAEGTTEENDTTQQPNHTDDPSTNSEHESTSVHEEDIDMSQLVTSLEAEQRKRKKVKEREKNKTNSNHLICIGATGICINSS
ncbi:unnamed protein product [Mytilus edulis]|uniref:CCHC-type domain-containing protein n=1 Tax=Mytilus edulis TaxID=6550 RepID=A0A8S3T2Y0_MYTED|nr:unnamed protein product [Mytilus edulis]